MNGSVARLKSHLATPLYRNGYALMLSSATTSTLGVGYWILAARMYKTADVGLNSAAISAMLFLAGVSQLNLMSALLRFLPGAGRATMRFLAYAYLISVSVAAVVSIIFIRGLHWWAPSLGFLASNPFLTGWFVVATMAWCIFVLQDSALTGLRQATWVPIENAAFSVAKIAFLIAFARSFPQYGLLASWTIGMAVTLLPVNVLIFRRLIPKHVKEPRVQEPPLIPAQVARYVGVDYLGSLCWLASTNLLPIMVTQQAGATANAYFYLPWQISVMLMQISPNMGSSLVVESVIDPTKLKAYSYQVCIQIARLVVPMAAILVLGAPFILRIFGNNYATQGADLLRLLALSAIPFIFNSIYISVARVQRRVGAAVMVLASLCVLVLTLSHFLLQAFGILGVGLAWLVSQSLIAVVLLSTQLRSLWSAGLHESALESGQSDAFGGNIASSSARTGPQGGVAVHSWLRNLQSAAFSTRILDSLHKVAAGARLLPVLHRVRTFRDNRRRLAKATRLLPRILPTIAPMSDTPPPTTWTIHRITAADPIKTVVTLGPPNQAPCALLKLAEADPNVMGLWRQNEVLEALHADSRLGEWRVLLPTVLSACEIERQAFVVERMQPGREARRALASPEDRARLQVVAAATIGELHRRSATTTVVDAGLLECWLVEPLDALRQVTATLPRAGDSSKAIERLAAELYKELAGRRLSVSWVHGDFTPGNILLTPDGAALTGIVDWDLATPDGLPLLDLLLLLLSMRMVVQGRELGDIVRALLNGEGWTPHEQALMNAEAAALPGDTVAMRALVQLCWLQHVSAILKKATRYAGRGLWVRRNIEAVLQCL
ncbi:MAG: rane protein involved in the export of O-antigen and teichoic acid-like protein [Chloroflexi bacterium]|nr:rane protein involved in the export of O-antigen and teichoic acid-like protein [Chloroflexota bacterium]